MMAVISGPIPLGLPSGPDPFGSPVDPLAGTMVGSMGSGPLTPPMVPPELVSDPGFSGGYAFQSIDPMSGSMSRSPVDWGSLKKLDWSKPPPAYAMGAVMLGDGGEIFVNRGDSMTPNWHSVGSLYGGSIWSDPAGTGGTLSATLPAYTAPAVSPFGSGGMYGPDPMAAMMAPPAAIPTGLLATTPSAMTAPIAPPLAAPTPPVAPPPTTIAPIAPAPPKAATPIVARPQVANYGGGYTKCDPITGKCSRYA